VSGTDLLRGGAVGTFVKLPSPEVVEIAALAGLDFVVVDLEHSPLSIETAATLVALARARGLGALVRIPDHGATWVQRCLDAGAHGVMAPHVDTVEQARALQTATRFPPSGTRGCGPTTRAGGWGLLPQADYLAAEPLLLGQVESDDGVAAAEQVLGEGLVSSLFVGPADLALSLGVAPGSAELGERVDHVRTVSQAAGVPVGIAASSGEAARGLVEQGFDYVVVSNDTTLLGRALRDTVTAARGQSWPRGPVARHDGGDRLDRPTRETR
jgi:2-keto-3-deoxy-L-rhamnonate aldolase RhmA